MKCATCPLVLLSVLAVSAGWIAQTQEVKGRIATTPQPEPEWQKAAGGQMEFEVASVRLGDPSKFIPPNFPLSADDAYFRTGGRFSASFPLTVYIGFAYKLWLTPEQREVMLEHLPGWVSSDRYVIEARGPEHATKDQMRLMMQSLLANRFKLTAHFEPRDVPVFALVLDSPSRTGPKLIPHEKGPACGVPPPTENNGSSPPEEIFPIYCGEFALMPKGNDLVLGSRNTPMNLLGDSLASVGQLGRPVVDQTGLSGRFDYTLQWTPETNRPTGPGADVPTDSTGTSFLQAVREQLGLKLKPTRSAINVFVVDHVERPSEN